MKVTNREKTAKPGRKIKPGEQGRMGRGHHNAAPRTHPAPAWGQQQGGPPQALLESSEQLAPKLLLFKVAGNLQAWHSQRRGDRGGRSLDVGGRVHKTARERCWGWRAAGRKECRRGREKGRQSSQSQGVLEAWGKKGLSPRPQYRAGLLDPATRS
jgi:hypothetical protein